MILESLKLTSKVFLYQPSCMVLGIKLLIQWPEWHRDEALVNKCVDVEVISVLRKVRKSHGCGQVH